MKASFKRALMLGLMAFMALLVAVSMTGCGEKDSGGKDNGGKDNGIWFFVNPDHGFFDGGKEQPMILKLVKSVDELQELCDESGITYGGAKYGEAFFAEKAIIVRAFWFSPYVTSELNKIQIADGIVTIYITTYEPKSAYPGVASYAISCIEVNKADLSDASEIQINTTYKFKK